MSINLEMHSPEIGSLLEALAKAQGIMEGAKEDSNNPFFKSTYADLTSVWEACRNALSSNGLSVVQTIQMINGNNCLVSILGHISGQWIKSFLPIRPAKDDIQSLGSAITYCRRYALAALVGVCPVDDDGESAMDRTKKAEKVEKDVPYMEIKWPEGVNVARVDEFIKKIAETSKTKMTINQVRKRASENMNDFYNSFVKWDENNPITSVSK